MKEGTRSNFDRNSCKCRALVVGAGLAGSTCARLLAEKGWAVLVLEKEAFVGGHCHDHRNEHGITVHQFGPHIFHTRSERVWNWVNRFSTFAPYVHRVLSRVKDRLVPFPISLTTLESIFERSFTEEEVAPFLAAQVSQSSFASPPMNFRDQVVSQVGEQLYELFYENYTRKQWGRDPRQIAPEVALRIPVRTSRDDRYFSDPWQGIPSQGYTALVSEILTHPGIEILTRQDHLLLGDQAPSAGITIYTGEMDRYFHQALGPISYRSLELEWITLPGRSLQQPAAVVNEPGDPPWTRTTEYRHFLNETAEVSTLCREYPRAQGRPYYITMTPENLDRISAYRAMALEETRTRRVFFVGRLAEGRYYNMDQVVGRAMEVCAEIDAPAG